MLKFSGEQNNECAGAGMDRRAAESGYTAELGRSAPIT